MNRKDIKGFTLKIFGYYLEFVFIKYIPKVFSINKPLHKTLFRVE